MKAYREECAWTAVQARPTFWPWPHAPVEIDVEYRSTRKSKGYQARDIMNAMAALKPMCDGLVDADIVPDDSKTWLSWGRMSVETKADKVHQEGVYVHVRRP